MTTAPLPARPLRESPGRGPDRGTSLRVVGPRRRRLRRRIAPIVSASLVTGSLLLVVVGHSVLDQDQIRLSSVQSAITAAEATHRQDLLAVASLENPSRIVGKAETTLHMVVPPAVTQLPHVTLGAPPAPGGSTSPASTGK